MALTLYEAGSGPPILFLHGWTMAGDIFADQFDLLSDRFHCLAPDLPGHGASGGTPTIPAAADEIAALLKARALRDVTLVGWSLGAAVGWHLLDRLDTGRIARMVSVDMSPRIVNDADWRLGMIQHRADSATGMADRIARDWPGVAEAVARGMFADNGGASMTVDAARARILSNDPARMAAFWQSLLRADMRKAVARLSVPLLAMHGEQSRVYPPETARWLEKTAPNATRVCLKGAGHSPHLDCPQGFAATLAAFITSHHRPRHPVPEPARAPRR